MSHDQPIDASPWQAALGLQRIATRLEISELLRIPVRRVLQPGGSFLFVEHGLAAEARVARWQARLTPVWRRLAGGCQLNRSIDQLIERAGLRLVELETGYLIDGPRFATFHYRGRAAT